MFLFCALARPVSHRGDPGVQVQLCNSEFPGKEKQFGPNPQGLSSGVT